MHDEAAFYGPKIDFVVQDALKRGWQLATIQLDFAMPERFDLSYVASSGAEARPIAGDCGLRPSRSRPSQHGQQRQMQKAVPQDAPAELAQRHRHAAHVEPPRLHYAQGILDTRCMKGLISIIVLLGVAGTIFVAGWIQILLPPATYAVLFSKTGAYDSRVIAPGTFAWRWERVIPGNVTLYFFAVQPTTVATPIRGQLASADTVASVLPGNADFGYQATVTVAFAVRPEALPQLVAMEGLLPESLPGWTQARGKAIAHAAFELVQRGDLAGALPNLAAVEAQVAAALAEHFPAVEIRAVRFADLRLPDLELYQRARRAYLALLEARHEARRAAALNLATERERGVAAAEQRREALQVLREYGQVLEEFPILIQFLALQSAAGRAAFIDLPAQEALEPVP